MKVKLSKHLSEGFANLLENHPPKQLSIRLRHILFDYIGHALRIGFPIEFAGVLGAFEELFDLLDLASRDMEKECTIAHMKTRTKSQKSVKTRPKQKKRPYSKSLKKSRAK